MFNSVTDNPVLGDERFFVRIEEKILDERIAVTSRWKPEDSMKFTSITITMQRGS